MTDPEVVFLDEMTTGLDPAARHTTWELIEAIRERGTTVVLVTHFMDEAERLCDRIAIMDAGRIVAMDTPAGLIEANAGAVRVKFSADRRDDGPPDDLRLARRRPARALGASAAGRTVEVMGDGPVLAHVAAALLARGLEPSDLRVERPTLEDTFLKLTGHGLE